MYAKKKSRLTDAVERLCMEDEYELIGSCGGVMRRITPGEVCCFCVEGGKVYALCEREKLQLKCRLYTLEEALGDRFVKLNQSCLANTRMIERFEVSFSGALRVKFKNGYCDYVSRRNLKNVKERLGLK